MYAPNAFTFDVERFMAGDFDISNNNSEDDAVIDCVNRSSQRRAGYHCLLVQIHR